MGIGIIGWILVRIRALGVRAHQPNAGAAGEGHGLVALRAADQRGCRRAHKRSRRRRSGHFPIEGTTGAAIETTAGAGGHVDGPRLA